MICHCTLGPEACKHCMNGRPEDVQGKWQKTLFEDEGRDRFEVGTSIREDNEGGV